MLKKLKGCCVSVEDAFNRTEGAIQLAKRLQRIEDAFNRTEGAIQQAKQLQQ